MKRRPILLKRVYEAPARQDGLRALRRRGRVTLLFAARSREQNNAVVLRDFLEGHKRHERRHAR